MRLSDFKVDDQKVKGGVVHKFDADGKCYIRVRRYNDPKFQKELRSRLEPYKNHRSSKIPPDVIDAATKEAMARTILVEMVGFEDDFGDITGTKGAVIEDTVENREKVLKDKSYEEFLQLVSTISQDFERFKVETEEEELGK